MRFRRIATVASVTGAVAALSIIAASAQGPAMKMDAPTKAVAVLVPTKSGGPIAGTIVFTKTEKGTRVQADLSGVPAGKHGFHIHEFGDASSPDGKAAGGHFDPKMAKKHGDPSKSGVRHLGDLGNITADDSGKAAYDSTYEDLPIDVILGHGLVVHEKADDFGQPVGNAGGRLAVAVIGIGKGM